MGSEDLHHRRKARQAKDLSRKKKKRDPHERVLIVCEGEKTEPNYFNGLIDFYRINTANVAVDGNCGSSPICIVDHAIQLYKVEKKKGDSFDRVYCVFDQDSHETYAKAIDKLQNQKPIDTFFVTTSVPCFEYWLILHFVYTTKPYCSEGKRSCGAVVLRELEKHMPHYKKGLKNVFSELIEKLEFAKENAIKSIAQARKNDTDNPTTLIYELVEYLQNIKK